MKDRKLKASVIKIILTFAYRADGTIPWCGIMSNLMFRTAWRGVRDKAFTPELREQEERLRVQMAAKK